MSCINRNPWPTAPAYRLKWSRYLMVVRLPMASTLRAVQLSKEMPPDITDPLPNQSCWRMLQAAECNTQCLQTLLCPSHMLSVNLLSSVKTLSSMPVANLLILVFSGKCHTSCIVLACKQNLWNLGPHTILMESVSDCFLALCCYCTNPALSVMLLLDKPSIVPWGQIKYF